MYYGGGVTGHAGQVGKGMTAIQAMMGPGCVTAARIVAVTIVGKVMTLDIMDATVHRPRESRVQGGEDEQTDHNASHEGLDYIGSPWCIQTDNDGPGSIAWFR